jgi:hypothetical protein
MVDEQALERNVFDIEQVREVVVGDTFLLNSLETKFRQLAPNAAAAVRQRTGAQKMHRPARSPSSV